MKQELNETSSSNQFNPSQMLDLLEGLMIHVLEPPLNRQGPKWKSSVQQYYQVKEGLDNLTDRELLLKIVDDLHGSKNPKKAFD